LVKAKRRSLSYTAWSVAPIIVAALLLHWLLGKAGLFLAGLLALPWVAWRYDNETGTFLPLSVLLLFLFAVLALLLLLIALVLKT
jgi:hypothetical protein